MSIDLDKLDNIDYVIYLNRQLLKKIRLAIGRTPLECEDSKKALDSYREAIFGKQSYVGALSDIADIELKIEKQRPSVVDTENNDVVIDEKDKAIVEHFIARNSREF